MLQSNQVICGESRPSSFVRKTRRALLGLGLAALLVQGPAFATDPIDLDPDPDFAASATTTIVVDSPSEVDIQSLPPGRYLIVVVGEAGKTQTFEIWVH